MLSKFLKNNSQYFSSFIPISLGVIIPGMGMKQFKNK